MINFLFLSYFRRQFCKRGRAALQPVSVVGFSIQGYPPWQSRLTYIIIIIGFLINMQVQGQHPHQWAPFQIAGLLYGLTSSHNCYWSSVLIYAGFFSAEYFLFDVGFPNGHWDQCTLAGDRPRCTIHVGC